LKNPDEIQSFLFGSGLAGLGGSDMEIVDWKGPSIKVVGIGGAGCNAVDRMIQLGIHGVEFIAINSDAQALAHSEAPRKIYLGAKLTRSLGTGGDPSVGAEAALESREQIRSALRGADMVFIAAGMGGGTGTGASPVVAQIAREDGALTIAVVTKPFTFEGTRRSAITKEGIEYLGDYVDTLIVVPNDRLLEIVNKWISLDVSFRIADEVLRQVIQGISELVTRPGLINLDFADVRVLLKDSGGALISIGHGEGEHKALEAVRTALKNPLLDIDSVSSTDGILVNITAGEDITLSEVNQAMEMISRSAKPRAEVLFGTVIDPRMEGRVEITLIATGATRAQRTIAQQKEQPQPKVEQASPQQAGLTQSEVEQLALAEILGDELAVPAFMRSRQRVRMGNIGLV
jgi:cell division protein FtsZ